MTRLVVFLLSVASCAAAGAQTAPVKPGPRSSDPPSSTRPVATRSSSHELQRQAIERMRQGEYAAARDLLDELYRATPAQQRTRSMVFNRAIADIALKTFVMRAVRDTHQYLTEHPEEDEPATNVLAAALNLAARDPRLKRGPLWQSAFAEWERRNDALDLSRPGYRRWGTRWITDQERAEIRKRKEEVEQSIREQQARVEEARDQITDVRMRGIKGPGIVDVADPFAGTTVQPPAMTPAEVQQYEQLRATDWGGAWRFLGDFQRRQFLYQQRVDQLRADAKEAAQERADAEFRIQFRGEISQAQARLNVELYELGVRMQRLPRPEWPETFEAFDP